MSFWSARWARVHETKRLNFFTHCWSMKGMRCRSAVRAVVRRMEHLKLMLKVRVRHYSREVISISNYREGFTNQSMTRRNKFVASPEEKAVDGQTFQCKVEFGAVRRRPTPQDAACNPGTYS